MKKIIYFFCSIVFLFSCNRPQNAYMLEGKISNLVGDWRPTVYLDLLKSPFDIYGIGFKMIIDSATVSGDGTFKLKLNNLPLDGGLYRIRIVKKIDPPASMYRLFENSNSILLVLTNHTKLSVTADTNNFSDNYQLKGSPESIQLKKLKDIFYEDEYYGFLPHISDLRDSSFEGQTIDVRMAYKLKLDSANDLFYSAYIPKIKKYIDTVPNPLFKQIAVTQLFGWAMRKNYEETSAYIGRMCDQLSSDTSKVTSTYLTALKERIQANKFLPIGARVPDVTMNTPEGKSISLSALKGKLILLDFWASWCGPCMFENKNTIKLLYEQYKDKGLTIIGVSLDHNREKWLSAIHDNHFDWLQISDLKSYESEYVQAYRFNSIPQTFVLNDKKIIIAKKLRGSQLVAFVRDYFEKGQ